MSIAPLFAVCGSLLCGVPVLAAVHPQHVTLAEAEWNADSRALEVALRITPAQLEQVVERHAGRSVDLDAETSGDAVAAWVRSAFVVTPPDADPTDDKPAAPVRLNYVGKEVGISVAWVYFEAPLPNGWEDVTVANRVRLAIEPEQHNTLILSVTRPAPGDAAPNAEGADGKPRKERASYTFDRRRPSHVLRSKDLKPLKQPVTPSSATAPTDAGDDLPASRR
ncbi:DUF6702 family protein [Alienimonas chondri]|uniref:Uncharacterized protein n=1 Tax=Alienimonas chondri TaxID=2681879 RepID=A0ABX1VEI3_9PLAN|nr:DUF6702 family protein [Alienimonas chondri]NNJ26487.1 hypothetical protein [Alienimonas chondri]